MLLFSIFKKAFSLFQLTTENLLENINTGNYAKQLSQFFMMSGIKTSNNVIEMKAEN